MPSALLKKSSNVTVMESKENVGEGMSATSKWRKSSSRL